MPTLYLLNLFNTRENCNIQTNIFKGAHIGGGVSISDAGSGENFCGNAGDTTGHSTYTNESSSSSSANSSSSSASSAGQNAMQNAKNNEHHSSSQPAPASPQKPAAQQSSACAWGPGACGIILLIW